MTSLAEQFLDDVESSEDEGRLVQDKNVEGDEQRKDAKSDDNEMAIDTTLLAKGEVPLKAQVTSLLNHMDKIQSGLHIANTSRGSDAQYADDQEYNFVANCMEIMVIIDEEILSLYRKLVEAFSPNFPELQTLIFNPLDYARVVLLAANVNDLKKVDLRKVLPSGSVITVQVTAASSARRTLTEGELERVYELCHESIALDESRTKILAYVESRASRMAPNLVEVVGGAVAAKLMGIAGGLRELAYMPSSNVKVLGKGKKTLQGRSSATTKIHEGVIYTCPMVTNLPQQYRSKAGDVLTGKASLAARVDACREQRDGSVGRKLREKLEEKFLKWQEPPPAKTLKPLPVPGEEAKRKHRGGKRARREKERLGITDIRRLANRVRFGEQEEVIGNDLENEGFGMLGAEGSKRLRIQSKKTDTVSIAAKRRLAKQKRNGISEAAALGITTNLADGIELGAVTPAPGGVGLGSIDTDDTKNGTNYFSSSAPFLQVKKEKE